MRLQAGAPYRETTLGTAVSVSGRGLHTGAEVSVTLRPAPAGTGLQLRCGDLLIPCLASSVVETRRCTSLGLGGARVDTVEHALAALFGLAVDNAEIVIDGPEMPILDGSAAPWVAAIRAAGICELDGTCHALALGEAVVLSEGDTWLLATPSDRLTLTCATRYDHPLLGSQVCTISGDPRAFADEVAPARTFGFAEEVEALRRAGLALGGTLDNALVVYADRFSDELRLPDECLRHKVLDLWGDLALAGRRLQAAITAIKPGHRANTAFAAMLAGSGHGTDGR